MRLIFFDEWNESKLAGYLHSFSVVSFLWLRTNLKLSSNRCLFSVFYRSRRWTVDIINFEQIIIRFNVFDRSQSKDSTPKSCWGLQEIQEYKRWLKNTNKTNHSFNEQPLILSSLSHCLVSTDICFVLGLTDLKVIATNDESQVHHLRGLSRHSCGDQELLWTLEAALQVPFEGLKVFHLQKDLKKFPWKRQSQCQALHYLIIWPT